jgi:sensor domain CHASE-containing protein
MNRILKSRKISLGRYMIICMTGLLLSVGTLFWWATYSQLAASFDTFDVSHYENQLKRVGSVIKQHQLSFELQIKDYAHRDDTEAFVLGDYPVYIEENFTPISLAKNQVSGYLIARLDGSFSTTPMMLSDDALIPMPAEMSSALSPLLPTLMTADKPTANTGLFWFDGQAILVSGVTITDSNESRSPSGYLLFFRHFDRAILDGFRSVTSVDFTLLPQLENNKADFKVRHRRAYLVGQ